MDRKVKTIPYGVSDFADMRRRNGYYVDNTWGIPLLEQLPYQLFLRPRRFGKSLLLSILHYYYDINTASRFDELFEGTWIHEHPTEDRGRFLVMHFDFSAVEGENLEDIQNRFERYRKNVLDGFVRNYKTYLPEGTTELVTGKEWFSDGLDVLMDKLSYSDKKIFILVDEYDNFSNRLLAQAGDEAYQKLCHGDGFFKSFFALLKAENRVVTNIFLTGVSPMTLDDVTSGFNIAENISQDSTLVTLCGFTRDDIRNALDYYADAGRFNLDKEKAFKLVTEWYDNYRFSINNDAHVCNPILLLGFLRKCMVEGVFPSSMIEENLRTDYHKLQHIVTTNGKLNGKFHALETLVADGSVATDFVRSFQAVALKKPESFLSLLFYYGMVTIGGRSRGKVILTIPNQLMNRFIADFLLNGYKDCCKVDPRISSLAELLGNFAYDGDWRPVFDQASQVLKETLCSRDLMDGEKAIQAGLASLLSSGSTFHVYTEHRAGFGFADLSLAPRLLSFPDIAFAALIEVKYIKKSDAVTDAAKATLLAEAKAQLEQYATDHRLAEEWRLKPNGTVTLIRLAVVFHGEDILFAEEI